MRGSQNMVLLMLILLVQLLPLSVAVGNLVRWIEGSNQSIQVVGVFVFKERGGVELSGNYINFNRSPKPHELSQMGFYLSPRGMWGADLLKQYGNTSVCYLHSDIGGQKKIIYTLDKLQGRNHFYTSERVLMAPGYYSLLFENCLSDVELLMETSYVMYNLDGNGDRRNYLSWWGSDISWMVIYAIFISLYIAVAIYCRFFHSPSCSAALKFSSDVGLTSLGITFILKLFCLLMMDALSNFFLQYGGYPWLYPDYFIGRDICTSLSLAWTLLLLQGGCIVRSPQEQRKREESCAVVVLIILFILCVLEFFTALKTFDAYSVSYFIRLNALRCVHYFVVIMGLSVVRKDNTDNVFLRVRLLPKSSIIIRRRNVLLHTVPAYFALMHLSFLLDMFPSTAAQGLALGESATFALFIFIFYLHWPRPSALIAAACDDNNLGANLISQP